MTGIDVAIDSLRSGAPWYGTAVGATTLLVRAFRAPAIQRALPKALQWHALPRLLRQLAVVATSAASSWLAALAAGQTPRDAFVASVPVALCAIGAHKLTKAAGHAHTRRVLSAEGPEYRPGAFRRAVSPVLPIDHKRMDIMQRLHSSGRGGRGGGEHV